MSSIKISACIITYNQESYIRECLEGALCQKVDFTYEIVIGDDCSTDGTSQICKEYATKYPKLIKYFPRDKNLGMTGNWKRTIEDCQGEYIALCEGDDYWTDPKKLQRQVDFLDNNSSYVGCFHNVVAVDEMDSQTRPMPWRSYTEDSFTLKDTFSRTALFHTCSFVFRNKLFKFPEWFNHVKSADMSLFSIIASIGDLKLLDGNMSVYRKNEGGITTNEKLMDYHINRILLWQYIDEYYDFKYASDITRVMDFHKAEVKKTDTSLYARIRRKLKV